MNSIDRFGQDRADAISRARERLYALPPTYHNLLALAIAQAGPNAFKTGSTEWSRAIADFKNSQQEGDPDYLKGVYFDRRDPSCLYSEQVEGFLGIMMRSGVFAYISVGKGGAGGGSEEYRLLPEAREEIVKSEAPRFRGQEDYVQRLAAVISERLSIESLI